MTELVNALLNVTRYELGTFLIEPEKVNLKSFLQNTKKDFEKQTSSKKISLSLSVSADLSEITTDKTILDLIFDNLISNAIKYSPTGSKIKIRAKKSTARNFTVEIEDYGFGIPENQQNEIFKKMFRADNVVSKDTVGTGLGLYMVKSLVETVGGGVSFISEVDKGTTFTIVLPITMLRKTGSTRFK